MRDGFVFLHFSVPQANHAMRVRSDIGFVSDENDGIATSMEEGEQHHDFLTRGGVKISGGFVSKQNGGII